MTCRCTEKLNFKALLNISTLFTLSKSWNILTIDFKWFFISFRVLQYHIFFKLYDFNLSQNFQSIEWRFQTTGDSPNDIPFTHHLFIWIFAGLSEINVHLTIYFNNKRYKAKDVSFVKSDLVCGETAFNKLHFVLVTNLATNLVIICLNMVISFEWQKTKF